MAGIQFMWEQIAGRDVSDICDFDKSKVYVVSFNDCLEFEVSDIDTLFSKIPWYDWTVAQTLWHDANWNLLRS